MSDPESATGPARAVRSVLVVGGGLAATRTVAELRERGSTVGSWCSAPNRSRRTTGRRCPSTCWTADSTWLRDEIGVDLPSLADEVHLSTPARGLAITDTGVEVQTDDGARSRRRGRRRDRRPRRPPAGLGGSADPAHGSADAAVLRAALVPGTRLVIIGAGWIGAEVATVAAAAGVDVTVLEATGDPLGAALGPVVGRAHRPLVRRRGRPPATRCARRRGRRQRGRAGRRDAGPGGRRARRDRCPSDDGVARTALPQEADGSLRVDEHHAVLGAPRRVRAVGDVALRRSPRHGWVPGGHWDGALRGPTDLVADLLGTGARPSTPPRTSSRRSWATSSRSSACATWTTTWSCAATPQARTAGVRCGSGRGGRGQRDPMTRVAGLVWPKSSPDTAATRSNRAMATRPQLSPPTTSSTTAIRSNFFICLTSV